MLRRPFYFFVLFLLLQLGVSAQQPNPNYKGESEYDIKNYKADPRDRLILETNYTNWLGVPKGIKTDWRCMGFAFYTMFDKPFPNSNFSFGFGLGLYVHNFSSNANFVYRLDSTNSKVTTVLLPKTIPYIANRYNERSVEIPIEF